MELHEEYLLSSMTGTTLHVTLTRLFLVAYHVEGVRPQMVLSSYFSSHAAASAMENLFD